VTEIDHGAANPAPQTASNVHRPRGDYPPTPCPTIYADTAINVAPSTMTVRFYMARLDPHFDGSQNFLAQPTVQIVMPVQAFVQMAHFFSQSVEEWINQGRLTREDAERYRGQVL